MTMHQILKIDEPITFLTISVVIGEKYLTPKIQQMVQSLNQHGTKSIFIPETSLQLFPGPIIDSSIIKKPCHVYLGMNQ